MSIINARRLNPMTGAWLIAGLLVLPAPTIAQVVVANADFEAVQIGPPFNSSNLANIPGWTHSGTTGDALLWHVGYADGGGTVVVAGNGLQFVTMGGGFGGTGTASWEQIAMGFTPGSSYNLQFQMSGEGGGSGSGPQSITVSFPSGSSTGPQTFTAGAGANYWSNWEQKSYLFVATSSSVDIRFSASTPFDVGLDNIRVTPVPEPASLTLLALAAITARIRRRTRRVVLE
jgi:PEP-CTERM motif